MIRRILIDADYSTDPGDFGALALALTAHRLGFIDLGGVIINTSFPWAPGAVDAHCKTWGLSGKVLGTWKGALIDESLEPSSQWCKNIYDNFPRDVGLASTVPDSTVAYRTFLAAQTEKIDIITIGFLNALSALLLSPADGISPLTGSELIAAKVRRVWSMAGEYPSGPSEWNMRGGATARSDICTASNNVATLCPVPVYWVGFELGTVNAGGTFGRPTSNIVGLAYQGFASGRPFWDELPVLACMQELSDFRIVRGTQTVNTTTGVNTWANSAAGKDAYLRKVATDSWLQSRMNAMIAADPAANPILSSWGASVPGFLQVRVG